MYEIQTMTCYISITVFEKSILFSIDKSHRFFSKIYEFRLSIHHSKMCYCQDNCKETAYYYMKYREREKERERERERERESFYLVNVSIRHLMALPDSNFEFLRLAQTLVGCLYLYTVLFASKVALFLFSF